MLSSTTIVECAEKAGIIPAGIQWTIVEVSIDPSFNGKCYEHLLEEHLCNPRDYAGRVPRERTILRPLACDFRRFWDGEREVELWIGSYLSESGSNYLVIARR